MAVDVPVPRPEPARLPLGLERLASVSAAVVLAAIVSVSFVLRAVAALAHATPLYFSDEYIYASLARSLAQTGRPLIRHAPAHFPALLEPILAAPFWLTNDPDLAYRLTQAENALAMSLAAVPVFLLSRRLGLGKWLALAAAALAVASPDLFFASFVLADPLAYPLVLAAVYAGVCALANPTRRSQLAFLAFAALATAARIQYVLLPLALVGAAVLTERGNIRSLVRRFRLTLVLLALPAFAVAALGPSRFLGYYSLIVHDRLDPAGLAHWIATDAMLLVYCAGWVLVPGALVGVGAAIVRPRSREEAAFGAFFAGLAAVLFAETSIYATNGSPRFQERYFMALLPLVLPAFGLYLKRGRPARLAVALGAAALLALASRVPLSGYTIGDGKQDSPFLFGIYRLEALAGIGTGSLAVAVGAALLSALAVAVAYRPRLAGVAIGVTLVLFCAVSTASVRFDRLVARSVKESFLPPDARWIDHAHLGKVILIQTPATPHVRAHEQLFWNTSIDRVVFLDNASRIDAFPAPRVRIARDGRITFHGRGLRSPLVISNYAVRVQLRDAVRVASGAAYDLWRPVGTPRVALFAGGLYHDGWLADAGHITVWPDSTGRVRGTLRLVLSLPAGTERTPLRLSTPGIARRLSIAPGETRTIVFHVSARGPWTLRFRTSRPGYLGSAQRPISVQAQTPVFTPVTAGTGAPAPARRSSDSPRSLV